MACAYIAALIAATEVDDLPTMPAACRTAVSTSDARAATLRSQYRKCAM